MSSLFISVYLKMFFMMTPFFVLSVFLTVVQNEDESAKKILALKVTTAIIVICLVLLFFGKYIFLAFGITLDAFRIGSGALLFLSAVSLVNGNKSDQNITKKSINDLAVVPLAIPIVIGPGTIGVLLVIGAELGTFTNMIVGSVALLSAVLSVGVMLYLSNYIERFVGKQGLLVISKITGLFLAALSAQIVFTGIKNFLNLS